MRLGFGRLINPDMRVDQVTKAGVGGNEGPVEHLRVRGCQEATLHPDLEALAYLAELRIREGLVGCSTKASPSLLAGKLPVDHGQKLQ